MKVDFKGLLEGVGNSLLVKDEVEKIAEERTAICKGCKSFSPNAKKEGYRTWRLDEHCTQCGCNIHAKTRCLSCDCPKELWMKETDETTDKEIHTKITDGK